MTAEPVLELIAELLARHRLDSVLIGNAAAALQGSPVTTLDLDFMFLKTPGNLRKLKGLARDLGAMVLRPYYHASELHRVLRDADGLQGNFMSRIEGIRSFRACDPGRCRSRSAIIRCSSRASPTSSRARQPMGVRRTSRCCGTRETLPEKRESA